MNSLITKKNLVGVVVWYLPEKENIINIHSYLSDLELLLIIDNSDCNNSHLLTEFDESKIKYIANLQNKGIARALNQGVKQARENGAEWVLTMDQDSSFVNHDLEQYVQTANEYTDIEQVAIFSPTYFDSRSDFHNHVVSEKYTNIPYTMTSGNILSVKALLKTGYFNEMLFIDWVDEELCIRIRLNKLNIVKINPFILNHFVGNGTRQIKFFGVKKTFDDYAPVRYYYITRNALYVSKLYPTEAKNIRNRWNRLVRKTIMYDNNRKFQKIYFIFWGLIDYLRKKTGSIQHKHVISETKSDKIAEVSVALCTFNGEHYLREQLDSILNQTYDNITEIVCVDDNSTDKTWSILKEYSEQFKQFRIFRNEINEGYIQNFEKAVSLTTRNYIAISDQDDLWYPTKISKLMEAIGDSLMVYSDNQYIDGNGKFLDKRFSDFINLQKTTSCLNFALFNAISGHTMLIHRDLLKTALPFNTEIPYDFWLGFHAAQFGEIQYVDEPLVGYRQHQNNALGAIGHSSDKGDSELSRMKKSQIRVEIFSKIIAPHLIKERKVLEKLAKSYSTRSIWSRFGRIGLFWKNRNDLLLFKKRNGIRKMLFCIKVFWKYQ